MSRRTTNRRGLTLVELTVAVAVMALVTVVLGGLTAAVGTAREHVEGLREAAVQGRAATDRIARAVARAGVYRIGSGPAVPGVAVVTTRLGGVDLPDTLVVWTGGRDATLADAGTLTRLPLGSECLAFSPDPADPGRLVETTVPLNVPIDFASPDFAQQVRDGLASPYADKRTLCDRLRVGTVGGNAAAAVRFVVEPLALGAGLRQTAVRTELQVRAGGRPGAAALPVFGSAVRRY